VHRESEVTAQRRLTIRTDSESVDLVLPAAMPVELLIPPIVDAINGRVDLDTGLNAVTFQLALPAGGVLDGSKTLNELGIRDGCILTLVRSGIAFVAQPCDDAAEATSAAIVEVERPWSRRTTRLVGALASACLAVAAAAALCHSAFGAESHRAGCVGAAAATSLLALLAATIAYRVLDEPDAGLTLGLTGAGFAALTGLFAIPGGPAAPNMLFAAAAAAAAATIVRVFSCHAVVFTALACLATAWATAAGFAAVAAAPLPAIGAGVAAISLALIEAAAPISVVIARLSLVPAGGPDLLHARAIRAHTWINSLITAFSAAAALGAISATTELSSHGIVFAATVGGALMLRAGTYRDVGRSAPPIACGAATLCAALVAAAVAFPDHALHITALSMTLSVLALHLGFMSGSTTVFPGGRRTVELAQYFALATIAPLAFWLCGLFGAARSLNLP
jgi:type VII secretion integral membrane protein EccD